jgi:hypothetical protein
MTQKNPAFPALLALFLGWSLLWAAIATVVIIWRSILFAANRLSLKSLSLMPPVVSAAALAEAFEPMSIDENEIELESPRVTASTMAKRPSASRREESIAQIQVQTNRSRETAIRKGDFGWP